MAVSGAAAAACAGTSLFFIARYAQYKAHDQGGKPEGDENIGQVIPYPFEH